MRVSAAVFCFFFLKKEEGGFPLFLVLFLKKKVLERGRRKIYK